MKPTVFRMPWLRRFFALREEPFEIKRTYSEALQDYIYEYTPGFDIVPYYELYPYCPKCGCDLHKEIVAAVANQDGSSNIKGNAYGARTVVIAAPRDESFVDDLQRVVDPLPKANQKRAERNARRWDQWEFFKHAHAGKNKDENAYHHDDFVPPVEGHIGKRVIHKVLRFLRGGP